MSVEPLTTEAKLRAVLAKYRCGDTGCAFGCSGMGTNGGCRCFDFSRRSEPETRVRMRNFVRDIREVLR